MWKRADMNIPLCLFLSFLLRYITLRTDDGIFEARKKCLATLYTIKPKRDHKKKGQFRKHVINKSFRCLLHIRACMNAILSRDSLGETRPYCEVKWSTACRMND